MFSWASLTATTQRCSDVGPSFEPSFTSSPLSDGLDSSLSLPGISLPGTAPPANAVSHITCAVCGSQRPSHTHLICDDSCAWLHAKTARGTNTDEAHVLVRDSCVAQQFAYFVQHHRNGRPANAVRDGEQRPDLEDCIPVASTEIPINPRTRENYYCSCCSGRLDDTMRVYKSDLLSKTSSDNDNTASACVSLW